MSTRLTIRRFESPYELSPLVLVVALATLTLLGCSTTRAGRIERQQSTTSAPSPTPTSQAPGPTPTPTTSVTYANFLDTMAPNAGQGLSGGPTEVAFDYATGQTDPANATVNAALVDSVQIAIKNLDRTKLPGCMHTFSTSSKEVAQDLCLFELSIDPETPSVKIGTYFYSTNAPYVRVAFCDTDVTTPSHSGWCPRRDKDATTEVEEAGVYDRLGRLLQYNNALYLWDVNTSRLIEFSVIVKRCLLDEPPAPDKPILLSSTCHVIAESEYSKAFSVRVVRQRYNMDFTAGFAGSSLKDEKVVLEADPNNPGKVTVQSGGVHDAIRPDVIALVHFFPVSRTFRFDGPAASFGLGVGNIQDPLSFYTGITWRFPAIDPNKYFAVSAGAVWSKVDRIRPSFLNSSQAGSFDSSSAVEKVYRGAFFVGITFGFLGGEDKFKAVYAGKTK